MFGRDSKTKPFVTEPFVTGILVDGVGPTNSRHPKHLRWLPEVQPVMSTTLPGAEGRCFEVTRSPIPHNFRGKCVTKFKKKGDPGTATWQAFLLHVLPEKMKSNERC